MMNSSAALLAILLAVGLAAVGFFWGINERNTALKVSKETIAEITQYWCCKKLHRGIGKHQIATDTGRLGKTDVTEADNKLRHDRKLSLIHI